ncbi:MAG: type II toxin-antitoxin system Phd/YefM family antitoxin [Patescibacteria group bacterium]
MSISEARKRIFDIADKVQNPSTHYTLTENGKPKVVMMSAEEFESWQETLEVVDQFPGIFNDIATVEKDIKSGAYTSYISLDTILKNAGYIAVKSSSKRHAVSRTSRTKSRKGSR